MATPKLRDLSKVPHTEIADLIRRAERFRSHVEALQAMRPVARIFEMHGGGTLLVSPDPSKPGQWRGTRFALENGEQVPTGHYDAKNYADAIEAASAYSRLGFEP